MSDLTRMGQHEDVSLNNSRRHVRYTLNLPVTYFVLVQVPHTVSCITPSQAGGEESRNDWSSHASCVVHCPSGLQNHAPIKHKSYELTNEILKAF